MVTPEIWKPPMNTARLRRKLVLIVWGRLVTCGGLAIRLQEFRIHNRADCQSAAGYQPAPQLSM